MDTSDVRVQYDELVAYFLFQNESVLRISLMRYSHSHSSASHVETKSRFMDFSALHVLVKRVRVSQSSRHTAGQTREGSSEKLGVIREIVARIVQQRRS